MNEHPSWDDIPAEPGPGDWEDCYFCDGSGELLKPTSEGLGPGVVCAACRGKGRVPVKHEPKEGR